MEMSVFTGQTRSSAEIQHKNPGSSPGFLNNVASFPPRNKTAFNTSTNVCVHYTAAGDWHVRTVSSASH